MFYEMESFHGERNILFCLSLCDLINFLRDYKLWFQRILLRSPYLDVFELRILKLDEKNVIQCTQQGFSNQMISLMTIF